MTVSKYLDLKSFLLVTTMLASPLAMLAPVPGMAQIVISVQIEPPALPVYEQPPIPETGYLWTPGYWAYDNGAGYFWVPGTWVRPPAVNVLWTPPYWGWADGAYLFHDGYWGEHVGYYGGVDYGYGYGGNGYEGGRWQGGSFAYNSTVNNFGDTRIANTYRSNVTVLNNSRVSFAGGPHGLTTRPNAADGVAEHEQHMAVTADQSSHVAAAAKDPAFAAKQNGGHPAIAATARPAQFSGPGVVPTQGAAVGHPPERNGVAQVGAVRAPPADHAVAARPGAPPVPHPTQHAAPAPARPPVEPAAAIHGAPPAPRPAQHAVPAAVRPPPVDAAAVHGAPAAPRPVQHAPPASVRPPSADHAAARVAPPPAQHAPSRPAPAPAAHVRPAAAPHPAAKAPPAKAEEEKKPEH